MYFSSYSIVTKVMQKCWKPSYIITSWKTLCSELIRRTSFSKKAVTESWLDVCLRALIVFKKTVAVLVDGRPSPHMCLSVLLFWKGKKTRPMKGGGGPTGSGPLLLHIWWRERVRDLWTDNFKAPNPCFSCHLEKHKANQWARLKSVFFFQIFATYFYLDCMHQSSS